MSKVTNLEHYQTQLQMLQLAPKQVMKLNGWTQAELNEQIADLEKKIQLSKQGKASKRKGATYENDVAKKFLRKWGLRLVRTPASGGFQKSSDNSLLRGDLSCLDENIDFGLHIECKNHGVWKLNEWWEQAISDCPENSYPVIAFHRRQKAKEGKRVQGAEDFVMLKLEDFLTLVDKSKVVRPKGAIKRGKQRKKQTARNGNTTVKKRVGELDVQRKARVDKKNVPRLRRKVL